MPDVTPASADSMLLPSLGIASIAGNIDRDEHFVKIADTVLERQNYDAFLHNILNQESWDLVGLSGLTCSLQTALKTAQIIRQIQPDTIVVFGGYMTLCHVAELSRPTNASRIDFLVQGEGEKVFPELLRELSNGGHFSKLAGLSYKKNDVFIHNPVGELLNLDSLKLPARDARILNQGFHLWGIPADIVETSRGCTFDCAFCCVTQQYRRTYREYSLDRVLTDIEQAYAQGTRFIVLVDDNITLDLKRLDALCEAFISAKFRGLRFFAQAAVKPIAQNPDLVKKMRQAGFDLLFLGLENLIDRNLKFLNKKTSNYEYARQAVQNLRKNKIISSAGIIMGNPEDRAKDLWDNFNLVRELEIDLPNFMTLTPFPRTRIREELAKRNLITNPNDFPKYDLIQANVKTEYLSAEELQQLVKFFFKKYYVSWKVLFKNLMLRKYSGYAIKYGMGEFVNWIQKKIKFQK